MDSVQFQWFSMIQQICQEMGFHGPIDRQELVQMKILERNKLLRRLRQMANDEIRSRCARLAATGKDSTRSDRCRANGNARYRQRQLADSLDYYHEAVLWAPDQSESLALAYGNRSAAYFELGQFGRCLTDIQLALDNGYGRFKPEEKLHQRKNQCQARLSPVNAVDDSDLSNLLERPPFSNHVQLYNDPVKGRFLRAKTDIEPGQVIVVERPYASVLLEPYEGRYCHHCCRQLDTANRADTPVPCRQCAQLFYCSNGCRTESWRQYHRVECSLLPFLYQTGVGHLALRIFLVTDRELVRRAYQHRWPQGNLEPFHNGGFDRATLTHSYEALWSLLDHQDRFPVADLLHYAITAALMAELLDETDAEVVMVARCLLRHLCQVVTNGHAISHFVATAEDQFRDCRIGTGIYPSVSLLNHSCEPNVVATFERGTVNIIRACKPIATGAEVSNCYGVHFSKYDVADRQSLLESQYFFRCHCAVCLKEKTTTISEEDKNRLIPLLEEYSNRIETEREPNRLQDMATTLDQWAAKVHDRPRVLLRMGQLYDQLSYRYYVHFDRADLALRFCRASVAIVERIYGPHSIELCNELVKLADLATHANAADQRHCTKRAIQLLERFVTDRSQNDSCYFRTECQRLRQRLLEQQ